MDIIHMNIKVAFTVNKNLTKITFPFLSLRFGWFFQFWCRILENLHFKSILVFTYLFGCWRGSRIIANGNYETISFLLTLMQRSKKTLARIFFRVEMLWWCYCGFVELVHANFEDLKRREFSRKWNRHFSHHLAPQKLSSSISKVIVIQGLLDFIPGCRKLVRVNQVYKDQKNISVFPSNQSREEISYEYFSVKSWKDVQVFQS